jgi:RNA polymerase sigma-70 factor (ECF subfamily)
LADSQLEQFFRKNFPIIRAKCTRMLGAGEEAADVAQETFTRLCESGAIHLEAEPRLRWIYATSTRIAIDLLRRRKLGLVTSGPDHFDGEGVGEPSSGAPPLDDALAARRALAALASVAPAEELRVAMLCRVDGLTQAEAAGIAAISERSVRRLLNSFDERMARLGGRPS